jgi:hypothetical protein
LDSVTFQREKKKERREVAGARNEEAREEVGEGGARICLERR